jgi:hypothetical protein
MLTSGVLYVRHAKKTTEFRHQLRICRTIEEIHAEPFSSYLKKYNSMKIVSLMKLFEEVIAAYS